MSVLAQLAVNLVGRTVNFDNSIKRSKKELRSFNSTAAKSRRGMGRLNRTFLTASNRLLAISVAAQAAKAAIGFALDTDKQTVALNRQAQALGISVKSLDMMTFAAKRAGFEQTNVVEAMRTMQEGLAEARFNAGELSSTFNELGISVRKIQDLKPDQSFMKLGRELVKIQDPAKRMLAFNKAFGESDGFAVQQMFQGREFAKPKNSRVTRTFGTPELNPAAGIATQRAMADAERVGRITSSRWTGAVANSLALPGTERGERRRDRELQALERIEQNTKPRTERVRDF